MNAGRHGKECINRRGKVGNAEMRRIDAASECSLRRLRNRRVSSLISRASVLRLYYVVESRVQKTMNS